MNTPTHPELYEDCDHRLRSHGRTGVIACGECGTVAWFGAHGPLDPAEAVAALFGSFDLLGRLPAVGAPSEVVLAYRPGIGRKGALSVLPPSVWLQAGPRLWLSTDGELLLVSTPDSLMIENLTRGA